MMTGTVDLRGGLLSINFGLMTGLHGTWLARSGTPPRSGGGPERERAVRDCAARTGLLVLRDRGLISGHRRR